MTEMISVPKSIADKMYQALIEIYQHRGEHWTQQYAMCIDGVVRKQVKNEDVLEGPNIAGNVRCRTWVGKRIYPVIEEYEAWKGSE